MSPPLPLPLLSGCFVRGRGEKKFRLEGGNSGAFRASCRFCRHFKSHESDERDSLGERLTVYDPAWILVPRVTGHQVAPSQTLRTCLAFLTELCDLADGR
jgi:hypothetical protein